MEKIEAVNKLKKAGYQVQFDSSVVTVLLSKRLNVTQEIKKIKSFLQEIGYDASFGIKQSKEDGSIESEYDVEADEAVVEVEETEVIKAEVEEAEAVKAEVDSIDSEVEIGEQFSLKDFGIS